MSGPFEAVVDSLVGESLDCPAGITWVTKIRTRWTGLFDVTGADGSQSYRVTMDDIAGTNYWQVRFYLETPTGSTDARVPSVNARCVLATVVGALRQLVKERAPLSITFAAARGEGRSAIYSRLAKMVAAEFRMQVELLNTPGGYFYRVFR